MPEFAISQQQYAIISGLLPASIKPDTVAKPASLIGKEKKQPFLLVRMPVYVFDTQSREVKKLTSFNLDVTEPKGSNASKSSALKTTVSQSPLAAGSWYKLSVTTTGLYKIDYDFIKNKLGVDPAKINPAYIRVFGNGGNMLSENNAIPRRNNLEENAIAVYDGGDGSFNAGDYFVFYATGPTTWRQDSLNRSFKHQKHLYEDKAYYFINFDQGNGLRIADQETQGLHSNVTVSSYNAYLSHEEDLTNLGKMGKEWWGELFSSEPGKEATKTFNLDLGGETESVNIDILLGSVCPAPSSFILSLNGRSMGQSEHEPSAQDADAITVSSALVQWKVFGADKLAIQIHYNGGISSGRGYLNYIEVNYRRSLSFLGSQIAFRDYNSIGRGNIAQYQLKNANEQTRVWDITDPLRPIRMVGNLNGNTYVFKQSAEALREFVAYKDNLLFTPEFSGSVPNQNIHGSDDVEYIIVCHPDFLEAAKELAEFHRHKNSMDVLVTTTTEVYNEFSSGSQDISAIRDMAKMFYERAGSNAVQMPRYLLLMGDASYDYKNRTASNTNFVPTFQSAESTYPINGFCNDDFFAFLDDNEDIENTTIANTLDIGVGRLPVKNQQEAKAVVAKIKAYKSPASLGPWRLSTMFIADDEDNAGPHMEDGEIMSDIVKSNSNIYNATKVYLDATPILSTPAGSRAPNANKAINDQVYKGTLLLNYNGHGNTQVLAHERIVTGDDYRKWKNLNKLPFIITATCDFGRFDHPEYVSAGEELVLKPDGGVIAALTTTQLVYQYANRVINKNFIDAQFKHENGRWNTFGDAFRIAKNVTYATVPDEGTLVNFRKFALLGDPALTPDFPEYFVRTDEVIDPATNQTTDSIKALGAYIVNGSVTDVRGNLLSDFDGRLYVTIYDKPRAVQTITEVNKTFEIQNNIIYKGKVTVTKGKFSYTFLAPKDINYEFGSGKLSSYAENGTTDGAGADTSLVIGGYSDHPIIENRPPVVRPFMHDSLFRNGGITGANTMLYVILEDETGINVSGNSIGHDLIAVLDEDVRNPYILNDYYETALNTYKRGYVQFPIENLSNGWHTFRVKAWDANNNSGEGTVNFEVIDGKIMEVRNLTNYPNPFRDKTTFAFEHNHPGEDLTATVNIYTSAGSLVKTIRQIFMSVGSRTSEVSWDGTDNNGAKLPGGLYMYRISISTTTGVETLGYNKLILVN